MTDATRNESKRVEPWRARIEGAWLWIQATFLWRIWERMLENEFIDRSVALGAKGFISFFPLVVVVAAFVPLGTRHSILVTVSQHLGLHGASLDTVKEAFASSSDVRRVTGVLGLVFLFFYATSFTTALQRVFLKAWRRPPAGKAVHRLGGPAFLGAALSYAALLGALRHFLVGGPGTAIFGVLSAAASIALWWVTSWIMLRGQVMWRPLLVSGVFTGLGLALYAASANVWMPNSVSSNYHQFGFFGVALALVSWFTGAGLVILIGACASASLADEGGWLGRMARGNTSSVLKTDAPPSLPPPSRAMTLVNALGVHSDTEDNPSLHLVGEDTKRVAHERPDK
jgi:membrane protein